MLAVCFGFCVFSSALWLFYAISFILKDLNGVLLSSVGVDEFAIYISLVIVPIFLIWVMFGFMMQFLFNKTINKNLYSLFVQMKKNQDYSNVVARLVLEAETQAKDGFILDKVELLIADLNEILSEIIYKTKIASKEQIDALWQKAQNGGKWSFAKVIIEVWQNQSNFLNRVLEKAQDDVLLSGSILEFCARYINLVSLLEKHDKDKVFLNIVEAGVMGKVFSIFAPIDDEIKKRRGFSDDVEFEQRIESVEVKTQAFVKKDDFSLALERTFGQNEEADKKQTTRIIDDPKKDWDVLQNFEINLDDEPRFDIAAPEGNLARIENDLEVEEQEDEPQAYPFGNWMHKE